MTSVVALDPNWQGGRYTCNPIEGLRLARMLYYPWGVSAPYLDRLLPRQLAEESEESARSFGNWNANSLLLRYAASRAHDISTPFRRRYDGRVSADRAAPTLILPSASDQLLGFAGARLIRDGGQTGDLRRNSI